MSTEGWPPIPSEPWHAPATGTGGPGESGPVGYPHAEGYPAGGFPAGSFPAGGYPGGSFPAGSFPAGGYPGGSFPAGSYPGGGYAGPGGPWGPGASGGPGGEWGPGGPGGLGGPGGPWGPGYPGGPVPRGRRRGRRAFAGASLLLALAIAAGAFFGLNRHQAPARLTALTTRQIADQVDPALVDVVTTLGYQQAEAAGTGLVLTSSGMILTNNHVIEGATSIHVTDIGNGRSYSARVVGYDRSRDVAVLKLSGASGLTTVTTGNSTRVQVGQAVVGIGNAGGRGGLPSVVTGHVTGLNASVTAADQSAGTVERLHGLIGHNAPIRPGDSGGPLVNAAGQVIGIDTAASSNFRFSDGQTQAYAIPIDTALAIAGQIEAGQGSATVHIGKTGFLGVAVDSASQAAAQGVPAD